jgi:hypothetical protein
MATFQTAPVRRAAQALASRLAYLVAASPSFPPALIGVAVFIWFAADEGGYRGTTWLPAALLLLVLLGVTLVALSRPRPPRAALFALGLLIAYALWSYLSVLWADQPGIAWDGANRTVLYAIVFALFALWPMRAGPAAALLGIFGLGVAVVGLIELLRANAASSSIAFFHEGRLSEPVGYANANVALWFMAFWPCLVLASRREVPPPLRGLFLGAASLLAALAVLGQSRGWLITLPVMAVLAVVLVPGRGRTIAALATVGVGIALIHDPLLEVYEAFDPDSAPGAPFSDAVRSILLVSAAIATVGLLAGLADRRVRLPERRARQISATLVAAFALAGVGGVAAAAVATDDPAQAVSDRWKEFKTGEGEPPFRGSRFAEASLSSYRYDAWRVAWENFERRPLTGVGADNFARDFRLRGRNDQTPLYPHSLELRVISQTGLVGVLLLAGAIAAAFASALPGLRRGGGLGGAAVGAALLMFAYWAVHGSLDWFWEFPGLGGPAFAMLGLATAVAASRFPTRGARLPGGRWAVVATACLSSLAAVGLAVPWVAERDVRKSREIAPSNPSAALDRLSRASRLNFLSPLPDKTAAVIELRRGRFAEARVRLREVLERDEGDSFAYLQLAAIASVEGRRREALRQIEDAHRWAPRDIVVAKVRRQLERGRRVAPERVTRLIRRDIEDRIGPG